VTLDPHRIHTRLGGDVGIAFHLVGLAVAAALAWRWAGTLPGIRRDNPGPAIIALGVMLGVWWPFVIAGNAVGYWIDRRVIARDPSRHWCKPGTCG